jgi:hypothetical protein
MQLGQSSANSGECRSGSLQKTDLGEPRAELLESQFLQRALVNVWGRGPRKKRDEETTSTERRLELCPQGS